MAQEAKVVKDATTTLTEVVTERVTELRLGVAIEELGRASANNAVEASDALLAIE